MGGDFFDFCKDTFDLLPGSTLRNGKKLVYFKSWESIKDFVALIGAKDTVYDLANREIEHSFRGAVNRQVNCDSANIQRSVDASEQQVKAIEFLRSRKIPLPITAIFSKRSRSILPRRLPN